MRKQLLAVLALGGLLLSACSPSEPNDGALNQKVDGLDTCKVARVVASSEKAALMAQIADEFNNTPVKDGCERALVYTKASGAVMDGLVDGWNEETEGPRPDVWTPASSSWLKILESRGGGNLIGETESIANTPLVIAMPKPMAEALGWPDAQLGWEDVLKLANDPQGWGSVGHPEWGKFKLGKTNPNFSTSGLNATVGAYYAATGLSSDLTENNINDPIVRNYVKSIESSVVHYGDTTLTFLSNLQKAADEGKALSYISAVTVEEKSVWDYNQGNPTGDPATLGQKDAPDTPLVAIYPKEGTLISDNPYAVLEADWVGADSKTAAESFLKFLQENESQQRFQEAGFRNYQGQAGDSISLKNGTNSQDVATISAPSADVMSSILEVWKEDRKGARVLLVVDTSGSMGGEKIEMARDAINASLRGFGEQDQVGLAAFSDNYRMLVEIDDFTTNETLLRNAVSDLNANGGTALYRATLEGLNTVKNLGRSDSIDAVVVLSDGENTNGGSLDDILEFTSGSSETEPVKLFTIGYGDGADANTLTELAQSQQGNYYGAKDPSTIDKVMDSVISNF